MPGAVLEYGEEHFLFWAMAVVFTAVRSKNEFLEVPLN